MKEICIYNENKVLETLEKVDSLKSMKVNNIYEKLVFWVKMNYFKEREGYYYTTDKVLDDFINECVYDKYASVQSTKSMLNLLFKELDIDYRFKGKSSKEFKRDTNFYNSEDMEFIAGLLINPQDKFIVYALFNGIKGTEFEDLINIKVDDIDFDKHVIHLKDKDVIMDKVFEEITKKTIFQGEYYKIGNLDRTSKGYELNMSNKYILKPKPTSKNNKGLGKFSVSGMKTRLRKISSELEGSEYYPLTSGRLLKSGVLVDMKKIEDETGIRWTNINLEKYKKENHLSFIVFEMLNTYRQIYAE